MKRCLALVALVAFASCSPASNGEPDEPGAPAAIPTSYAAAGFEGYPTTKPDGSPLDLAYCSDVGDVPGNPFDDAKTCLMIACDHGDKPSCEMAETHNGNLWPDGVPSNGPSTGPTKLEGMGYLAARKFVLDQGWEPVHGSCGGGGTSDETCAAFPEIRNCSGVSPGYCDMSFARNGRCLVLVTKGGAPDGAKVGDTYVDGVSFRRGPCGDD